MNQNKIVVCITGSIGTGKSTVSNYIKEKGYIVIDSDIVAKETMETDSNILNNIKNTFGEEYFLENGLLDRKKLAKLIFKDEYSRETLNSIVHPEIIKTIINKISACKFNIVFVDIPLYFEIRTNLLKYGFNPDKVILVYADLDIQLRRIMDRDNISKEYALNKINSQIPVRNKINLSDYVINNNTTIKELYGQIDLVLNKLNNGVENEK